MWRVDNSLQFPTPQHFHGHVKYLKTSVIKTIRRDLCIQPHPSNPKRMISETRGFNHTAAPDSSFSTQQVVGSSLRLVSSDRCVWE